MASTLLYEVGEGIGNNVHATGTVYAMLAHPRFSDFIINVRTKHPEIWPNANNLIISPENSQPLFPAYDYKAHSIFRSVKPWNVKVREEIELPYDKARFRQEHEIEINASAIEKYFGVKLEARQHRRVIAERRETTSGLIGLINGGTRTTQWMNKRWHDWKNFSKILMTMDFKTLCFAKEPEDIIEGCSSYCSTYLTEAASRLTECEMVIGNDCGLLHVADALSVPVLGIWGPTYFEKNKPVGKYAKVVRSSLPCQPCQGTPLQTDCKLPVCMMELNSIIITGSFFTHYYRVKGWREDQ